MRRRQTRSYRNDIAGDALCVLVGIILIAIIALPAFAYIAWQRYRRRKAQGEAIAAPIHER